MRSSQLSILRGATTRAGNVALGLLRHNLESAAPCLDPDGLPSWWPFCSDALKNRVREAVRASRRVAELTQWFVKSEDLACVLVGPFPSPAAAMVHAEWLDSLPAAATNTVVSAGEAERLMATGDAWTELTPGQDRDAMEKFFSNQPAQVC